MCDYLPLRKHERRSKRSNEGDVLRGSEVTIALQNVSEKLREHMHDTSGEPPAPPEAVYAHAIQVVQMELNRYQDA